MTTVLQIKLGDPHPRKAKRITRAMESVRSFADVNGHEYIVLTEIPENMRDWRYLETISDVMRCTYAAEHGNVFYCDWDIILGPTFQLPVKPGIYSRGGDAHAIFYKTKCNEDFFRRMVENTLAAPKKYRDVLWKVGWRPIAKEYEIGELSKDYIHLH